MLKIVLRKVNRTFLSSINPRRSVLQIPSSSLPKNGNEKLKNINASSSTTNLFENDQDIIRQQTTKSFSIIKDSKTNFFLHHNVLLFSTTTTTTNLGAKRINFDQKRFKFDDNKHKQSSHEDGEKEKSDFRSRMTKRFVELADKMTPFVFFGGLFILLGTSAAAAGLLWVCFFFSSHHFFFSFFFIFVFVFVFLASFMFVFFSFLKKLAKQFDAYDFAISAIGQSLTSVTGLQIKFESAQGIDWYRKLRLKNVHIYRPAPANDTENHALVDLYITDLQV